MYSGPATDTAIHGSTSVWESLVYLNEYLEPRGWLAVSWHSDDTGKIWTFSLRRDVFFHSGKTLDANDIAANINRKIKNPRFDSMGFCSDIMTTQVLDKNTVRFILKKPLPHFPSLMSYYGSPVLNPEGFAGDGSITRIDGTGPYRFESISPRVSVILKKHNKYWGPEPYFSTVKFLNIPDATTRINSLINGDTDCIADIGGILPSQAATLSANPSIKIQSTLLASTHYLFFNCRKGYFHDKNNRHWLAGIIDWTKTIGAITENSAVPALNLFSPRARQWDSRRTALIKNNLNTHLPDSLTILVHRGTLQRFPYLPLAEIISYQLKKRGIGTRIVILEAGAYSDAIKSGQFDITFGPRNLLTGDPDFFYNNFLKEKHLQYAGCNQFIKTIKKARNEMNRDTRKKMYLWLARETWKELPLFPLFHDNAFFAYRSSLKNVSMNYAFKPDIAAIH